MSVRSITNLLRPTAGSSTRVEPVGYAAAAGYQDQIVRNAFASTRVGLASGASLGWSSSTDATAAADVGLVRHSAAVVKVTDGSSGNGTIRVGDGTRAAPAFSFTDDTATGICRVGTGSGEWVGGGNGPYFAVHPMATAPTALATLAVYSKDNGSGTPIGGTILHAAPSSYSSGAFYRASHGYVISDGNMEGLVVATAGHIDRYLYFGADNVVLEKIHSSGTHTLGAEVALGWSSTSIGSGMFGSITADVGLRRDASGVLALSNGSSGYGRLALAASVHDLAGAGSPEGAITAAVGSVYRDTSAGALYLKTSGAGNTGWTAVATGSSPWSREDGLIYSTTNGDSLGIGSAASILFSSTAAGNGSADAGIARVSAGVLKLTDGASNLSNLQLGSITQTTTNQSSITTTTTLSDGGTHNLWGLDLTDTSSNAATRLLRFRVGGSEKLGVSKAGVLAVYNGVATAGTGVPVIVATGRVTGQTAAVASIATYTVGGSDSSFLVSANAFITAGSSYNFFLRLDYRDESNTLRQVFLTELLPSGLWNSATISNGQGVGPYMGPPIHIRAKAGTAITVYTSGTFTTVTYNAEAAIMQIA